MYPVPPWICTARSATRPAISVQNSLAHFPVLHPDLDTGGPGRHRKTACPHGSSAGRVRANTMNSQRALVMNRLAEIQSEPAHRRVRIPTSSNRRPIGEGE